MRKGFTLIELVISLAIFSLLLVTVFSLFNAEVKIWKKIAAKCERTQIANFVLTRLRHDIRRAGQVLPASNPYLLSLKAGPDSIEYSLAGEKVRRKQNGASAYLTFDKEISSLIFSYPSSREVEIELGGYKATFALRN